MARKIPPDGALYIGTVLSPFEQEVAALARAGYGRNGIAAALGISPGTVKVVLRQIRWKLGEDWRDNPRFIWPDREAMDFFLAHGEQVTEPPAPGLRDLEPAAAAYEPDTREDQIDQEARDGRRLAALLILKRGSNQTLLQVSGLQRFWLKQVLTELEADGYLRLLAADRNDTFSPPWLPIVYRGRRAIRAASYLVRNETRVRVSLNEYLNQGLAAFVEEALERLQTAARLGGRWRKVCLPGPEEIWLLVQEAFGAL